MAVLFFSDDMDQALIKMVFDSHFVVSTARVNDTITAYQVNIAGVEDNEFVIARHFETVKDKIKIMRQSGHFVTNKN